MWRFLNHLKFKHEQEEMRRSKVNHPYSFLSNCICVN